LSSGFDEAAVTRSTFAARSRATCCSITVRVSGLAVRYRSNAPTYQRIATTTSKSSASRGNTAGEAATERTAVPCDERGLF